MRIIIPVDGNNLESKINRTFGRTKQFIIVDPDTLEQKLLSNEQNLQAAQGAGIQSAQLITKSGVDVLITMNCGPKAFKVLKASGIKIFIGKLDSIQVNIDAFSSGHLDEMTGSNVEGHWV